MKLHNNIELFIDSVFAAAKIYNLHESIIESDYWNTAVLYEIFHSDLSETAVLKGGTSLFKCHKLTERLPLDLDIVIPRSKKDSKNNAYRICSAAGRAAPEKIVRGITYAGGMIKRSAHEYRSFFDKNILAPKYVVLDISWLGAAEPSIVKPINSFIGEMMTERKMLKDIDLYDMESFEIKTLSLERTFCEKIIYLVDCSNTKNPYAALYQKATQLYGLHSMLKEQKIKSFFNSNAFNEMLLNVKRDNLECFGRKCRWLYKHPSEALVFKEPEETWDRINALISTNQLNHLSPDISDKTINIIATLKMLSDRLNSIAWN